MSLTARVRLVLILTVVVAAGVQAKQLYRWVDADGRVNYSQTPPPARSGVDVETRSLASETDAGLADCCRSVPEIAAGIAAGGMPRQALRPEEQRAYLELRRFVLGKSRMQLGPRQIGALAASACMSSGFAFCRRSAAGPSASARRADGSGSGFVLSGHVIVTNHHVVDGCARLTTHADERPVELLAVDERNDLALLRSEQALPAVATMSAAGAVRLGEPVTVAGFPLRGTLAEQLNVTRGDVSSLAGVSGDTRHFQLSAPVQPGNSGGPVLDRSGHVVGVVVARLNDQAVYQASGALPQNVNFAIRLSALKRFLDRHRIAYLERSAGAPLDQIDLAARAGAFTVPISCHAAR